MKTYLHLPLALISLFILPAVLSFPAYRAVGDTEAVIQAPQLKWQHAGCYSSWCETGWYSSPAVADLDKDGAPEVIGAAYSIFILNGSNGSLKVPRIDAGGSRAWPGVVVADLESDGDLEIVTADGNGSVHVFSHQGNPVWTKTPTAGNELRSLAVYDLDGDGNLEVLVASTKSDHQWWVYEHDGSPRAGAWPQHRGNSEGYSWGCYNQNIAAGDLDGDGRAEVFGPNDTHYLAMFEDDGSQTLANLIYGLDDENTQKVWSQVGVHVDHAVDLRGWAYCGIEHRPNFANSAPIMADLDNDGRLEAVVVGNVYNCGTNPYTDLYEMPFIFNADRTRWKTGVYDWTEIPTPEANAAPLSENYNLIENSLPNPVAADLDGDGKLEILYASYDGRVHAYWLDKTEHGDWPYAVYHPAEGFYRFASEPVVADLDNDGRAEVLFTSWTQKGSDQTGKLHILDAMGRPIYEVSLPDAYGGPDWNGAMAAPTLANIDADPDLEIVINTASSGLVAYDLPGTAGARVLWGTGRGSFLRSGSPPQGILQASEMRVDRRLAEPGEILTYTIILRNPGPLLNGVGVTNDLPDGITYNGDVTATSGTAGYANGILTWTGSVRSGLPVTISYHASVNAGLSSPTLLDNTAIIHDGAGTILQRQALVFASGNGMFLPIIR